MRRLRSVKCEQCGTHYARRVIIFHWYRDIGEVVYKCRCGAYTRRWRRTRAVSDL